MLDNCRNTSALFLSTNLNDPETLSLYVWDPQGELHIWCKIFHISDSKQIQGRNKEPKQGRARWSLVLTGVCHLKAVTDVHNVDLGKELRGFCELRQCKPKSCMFLGLLIRK